MNKETIVVWFSCGAASAVAAMKTIEKYGNTHEVVIVNNPVAEEHPDNKRFLKDVSDWLKTPIYEFGSKDFPSNSAVDVWEKRKYMSGNEGAPCTMLLKKQARYEFEIWFDSTPQFGKINYHVLGFTVDEWRRAKKFIEHERSNLLPILVSELITKADCFKILEKAGIKLPEIYSLGFPNANCIGCVKSSSPTYWNLVRNTFPDIFNHRAEQSRRIGCKLVKKRGKRIFLDELLPTDKGGKIVSEECGIFCNTK